MQIGMNLSGVSYYSTENPFIDRMKTSSNWSAIAPGGRAMANTPVPVDKLGYPTSFPAGAWGIALQVGIDAVSWNTPDRYVLIYAGTAKLDVSGAGARIVSSKPGGIVFDVTDNSVNFINVSTIDMSVVDPPHDMHLVRQDQLDLFKAGEIFNPAFLAKTKQWDTLRFMDWGMTNASAPASWATRTTLDSASWAYATGPNATGVPIEVMVALANRTRSNMWFNVPTQADDDYVRRALTLIRDTLDPSLTVDIEYSNEMWNWGFPAAKYAAAQGDLLFGTDANKDGKIDPADPKEHDGAGWVRFYGYRAAQIAAIAAQVFGVGNKRCRMMLATQTAYTGLESNIFDGALARAKVPVSLFASYAVTTYFGNALSGANAKDQATVLGWARGGDSGMAAAFKELEFGGALSSDDSLAALAKTLAYQAGVAKKYGLDLIAYEGGAHITDLAYGVAQPEMMAFIGKLMNDPRMGALYTKMVQLFAAAGGVLFEAFGDAGKQVRGGYWGILDDINQDHTPRYDALVALAVPKVAPVPAAVAAPPGASILADIDSLRAKVAALLTA